MAAVSGIPPPHSHLLERETRLEEIFGKLKKKKPDKPITELEQQLNCFS